MQIKVRSSQDLCCGILFAIFALFFAVCGADLAVGTAGKMGPGYAPMLLSALLAFVGLGLVARGLVLAGESVGEWHLRPLVAVVGAMLLYSLALESLGLVLTTVFVVVLSSFATKEIRPLELAAVSAVMATVGAVVFVYGLKLTIPLWPAF